jgi:4-aminobutyrate aminotransferase-like enzyme
VRRLLCQTHIARAKDSYIYDPEYDENFDSTSEQMSGIPGHGNPENVEVVQDKASSRSKSHLLDTLQKSP